MHINKAVRSRPKIKINRLIMKTLPENPFLRLNPKEINKAKIYTGYQAGGEPGPEAPRRAPMSLNLSL